jgi:hypothetical protein
MRSTAAAVSPPQDATIPFSERAMVARLETHRWHAQKRDRKTEKDVAAATGTDASRHKHTLVLLADKALSKVTNAFSAAAEFHRANTSPWEDGGRRILSSRLYSDYMAGIAEHRRTVEKAVDELIAVYPQLVEAERQNNKLFNEADYPSVKELRRRFGIETQIDKLTNPRDFRVNGLNAEETARIQDEIERRTQEKLNGVLADLWKRIHDCVERVAERLTAYDEREARLAEAQAKADRRRGPNKGKLADDVDTQTGTFTNTLITNLSDLVELLPGLDLTGDPELAKMTERLRRQLCPHEAEDLRKSPLLRRRVAENATKILEDVDARIAAVSDFLG